ncbi:MAG: hypothetical protein ACK52S_23785, partial [Pirellula sp.]
LALFRNCLDQGRVLPVAETRTSVPQVDGPPRTGALWALGAEHQKEQKKALSSVENLRECSTGLPPGLEQHIASDL